MSAHNRRAQRIDDNQTEIIRTLSQVPGVTVAANHDDLLVGYRGRSYWFEVKNPRLVRQDGRLRESALKPSQVEILRTWTGHYSVVWTVDQILVEIGAVAVGSGRMARGLVHP